MELPYIKPTRRVHESKFRCFEVGYCELGPKNRIASKRVLGECSDHIWIRAMPELGEKVIGSLNIDLTRDGYIRFFTHDEGSNKGYELKWEDEKYALSSAVLKLVKKEEVLIDEQSNKG